MPTPEQQEIETLVNRAIAKLGITLAEFGVLMAVSASAAQGSQMMCGTMRRTPEGPIECFIGIPSTGKPDEALYVLKLESMTAAQFMEVHDVHPLTPVPN